MLVVLGAKLCILRFIHVILPVSTIATSSQLAYRLPEQLASN